MLISHKRMMIALFVGGVGVGLVALKALLSAGDRGMAKQAENLLYEVAPAAPSRGEGGVATGPSYRNVIAKDGFPELDGVKTLYELFSISAKRFAKNPCLGTRQLVRYSQL